eukprot:TRINITY_DN3288_c1_g1_i7.p1 TRINITY_DN3288_c1_g1~~TRINITY_DN3288_c1_g1_i7.p1  ORF type:complete len:521 (+),score=158.04 TRINITY_DN3288_c1_g1_i7:465-2027(+)
MEAALERRGCDKKLRAFHRNKHLAAQVQHQQADEANELQRKVRVYEALLQKDAYVMHRQNAALSSECALAVEKEKDAQRVIKGLRQRLANAAADQPAEAMGSTRSSVHGDKTLPVDQFPTLSTLPPAAEKMHPPPPPLAPPSPNAVAAVDGFNHDMNSENAQLRYDLNVRCKVLWHLEEGKREAERELKSSQEELATVKREYNALRDASKYDDKLVDSLMREVETSAAEVSVLRDMVTARDEQVARLMDMHDERGGAIEKLLAEAVAREDRLQDLLVGRAAPHTPGDAALLAEIAELKSQLQQASDGYHASQVQLGAARMETAHTRNEKLEKAYEDVEDAGRCVLDTQAKLDASRRENDALRERLRKAEAEAEELRKAATTDAFNRLDAEKQSALGDVQKYKKDNERLRHYIATLGGRLDALSAQYEAKRSRVRELEAGVLPASPRRPASAAVPSVPPGSPLDAACRLVSQHSFSLSATSARSKEFHTATPLNVTRRSHSPHVRAVSFSPAHAAPPYPAR